MFTDKTTNRQHGGPRTMLAEEHGVNRSFQLSNISLSKGNIQDVSTRTQSPEPLYTRLTKNGYMRIVKFFLLFSTLLAICSCRGCFRTVSDEILPPGGNPELIHYLQGTWILTANNQLALQIKRDSIIEFYNASLRSTRNLFYVFAGTAESYFTKDSAFDFSSESGRTLSSDEFKLIENGESASDTITHLLAYVSKSRLIINTHGKFAEFKRAK